MFRIIQALLLLMVVQNAFSSHSSIDYKNILNTLDEYPSARLIDIRPHIDRVKTGTINHHQNLLIPRGSLEIDSQHQIPDKHNPVIIYGNEPERLHLSLNTMIELGYDNVFVYYSGLEDWESNGGKIYSYDNYKYSPLYNRPIKVSDRVYSAIGATQPPSSENFGHNNNLSFIIGDKEVVVFNAGGSYLVAVALHEEIKKITDKPVKYLVYENAQGHAVLGSSYWKDQGVEIIAHRITQGILKNTIPIEARAKRRLGAKFFKTKIISPDITFNDSYDLTIPGVKIELLHFGPAHEPDDILLWMPDQKILISGDFTFNERMLPIQQKTNIDSWIELWPKLISLNPKLIIPGHGNPTDLKTVASFTIEYLQFLKNTVLDILENDGDLIDVINADSSKFKHMDLYKLLKTQNLKRVFNKLEFDF